MIRKSLFWGLTLMLVAVLVWLVLQSRKEETKRTSAPVEIVKTAKLSPTRVVAPKDLEVAGSPVKLAGGRTKSADRTGVAIHNRGDVAYHNIMLKITCLGGDGKVLHTQTRVVGETLQPSQTLAVGEIATEAVPPGTARCTVTVLYADLGPASNQ